MKILKILSEHKKTKRDINNAGIYHAHLGWAECQVEENGKIVTRHLPIKP